jgi:glycosyltransferase involved in cell wall biosynthesis
MPLKKPLITIITPTYNAGKFIEKCIGSVQDQRFTQYEHILIDGGSADKTIALLKEYEQRNENVRFFIGKDEGIYDAMNKGIALAAGEWLYFLGADDFLYSNNVLEEVAQAISMNSAKIIYGNVFFESMNQLYDGKFDIEKILTRNINHQAVFYHISVFRLLGLYNLRYRVLADYDINIRAWLSGRIETLYIPLTIACFADGGVSSLQQDERFNEDYPNKTIDVLFAYEPALGRQINILSKIYRKILIRYPISVFMRRIWNRDHPGVSFAAIAWMFLSSPFRIMKNNRGF